MNRQDEIDQIRKGINQNLIRVIELRKRLRELISMEN